MFSFMNCRIAAISSAHRRRGCPTHLSLDVQRASSQVGGILVKDKKNPESQAPLQRCNNGAGNSDCRKGLIKAYDAIDTTGGSRPVTTHAFYRKNRA